MRLLYVCRHYVVVTYQVAFCFPLFLFCWLNSYFLLISYSRASLCCFLSQMRWFCQCWYCVVIMCRLYFSFLKFYKVFYFHLYRFLMRWFCTCWTYIVISFLFPVVWIFCGLTLFIYFVVFVLLEWGLMWLSFVYPRHGCQGLRGVLSEGGTQCTVKYLSSFFRNVRAEL